MHLQEFQHAQLFSDSFTYSIQKSANLSKLEQKRKDIIISKRRKFVQNDTFRVLDRSLPWRLSYQINFLSKWPLRIRHTVSFDSTQDSNLHNFTIENSQTIIMYSIRASCKPITFWPFLKRMGEWDRHHESFIQIRSYSKQKWPYVKWSSKPIHAWRSTLIQGCF